MDYDIIEKQDYPLLLSKTITLNIPKRLHKSMQGNVSGLQKNQIH